MLLGFLLNEYTHPEIVVSTIVPYYARNASIQQTTQTTPSHSTLLYNQEASATVESKKLGRPPCNATRILHTRPQDNQGRNRHPGVKPSLINGLFAIG